MDEQQAMQLRSVTADEGQSLPARRAAAEHLIGLHVEAVEAAGVSDDDPEVSALRTPWKDAELASMFCKSPDGPPLKGWPLSDAKSKVLDRRKLRALLAVVVDEKAHPLERLAACEKVLRDYPVGKWRMNSYTAARLLAEILPADSVKWDSDSWRRGPIQVQRPPMELKDVWSF
jgi:hypothetical protein